MTTKLEAIARHFAVDGQFIAAEPFSGGHINDSFLLAYRQNSILSRFLLQRINSAVFETPARVMDNVQRVTSHLKKKLEACGADGVSRRVLTLVPTRENEPCHHDNTGACWRIYRFIDSTRTFDLVRTPEQARQAGRAFGSFQYLLTDLPKPRLYETIPDFHNTPLRLDTMERAVLTDSHNRAAMAHSEIEFARKHHSLAGTLLDLQQKGELPERIVHNDAKISNVLFDQTTGEALCVVDLDTVMPGLALYDFGDMMRSMISSAAEDEPDLTRVTVRRPLFEALANGYLEAAEPFLSPTERANLVTAGKLITLEQGVRFLTDFLGGDTYYKTQRPNHNIERCRNQFKLLESIIRLETWMTRFIEEW